MPHYSAIYIPDADGITPIQRTMEAARAERVKSREAACAALETAFPEVIKPFSDESVIVATKVFKQIGDWKVVLVDLYGNRRPVIFREGTLGGELIRQLL